MIHENSLPLTATMLDKRQLLLPIFAINHECD